MADFQLSIVAPDRTVAEERIQSLIAPGVEGYIGILAGHVPAIVALRPGLLEYRDATGNRRFVAISGGFLEVSAGQAIVLAERAQRAEEIDIQQAEADLERARRALRGEISEMSSEDAAHELEHAITRVRAAQRSA